MRVLLAASLGGVGHLRPVVAVGRGAMRAGHDTLLLVPPALEAEAQLTGVRHAVGAEPSRAVVDGIWDRVRAGPADVVTGLIDRELFAQHAMGAMLASARRVCRSWQPDLIVRDPCEYASAVAACEAGIRHLQVGISQAEIDWQVLEMVAPILERHRAGVAGAIRAAPYLTRFPGSLDPSPWPDTRRYREPIPPERYLPDWWPGDERPLLYVTFGSVVGHLAEAPAVFRTALDAVSQLPTRVLLTVGRATDVARLGTVPANTRVEAWVPQDDVLPKAAVVLCHGGSGTTFGALAHGVPLVVCPLFADQSENARLIRAAGCGVVVDRAGAGALRSLGRADVPALLAAVETVLSDPGYKRAAVRVGAEMARTPALDVVARRLLATN